MAKTFNAWLDTFIEEKELDIEAMTFDITSKSGVYHFIPCGVVIEWLKGLNRSDKANFKKVIVGLDFANADFTKFFRSLAQFMADSYQGVIQ